MNQIQKRVLVGAVLLTGLMAFTATVSAAPAPAPQKAGVTMKAVNAAVKKGTEGLAKEDHVNWLWTVIAAALVFFMQAGFGLVEAGFTRAKNAVNIMMKNFADMAFGVLAFWLVGFALMFGPNNGGMMGGAGFTLSAADFPKIDANWTYAFFFFQCVFAATAATIVSGAIAERTKFSSYIILSFFLCAFIYPISGSWNWGSLYEGKGWGPAKDMVDFAGSTVVHAVGGFAALAAAIVVGPRKGKFLPDGKLGLLPGHNIPFAGLGVLILWLGWFGFNAGSTTSLDGGNFAKVAMVTMVAACAGFVGAVIFSLIKFKKFDASFAFNGVLAGLVSITAGCYDTDPGHAIALGFIGGILVCLSVLMFDALKIDDPVGAISVHGICGIWGTVGLAFFNNHPPKEAISFGGQLIGSLTICAWAFVATLVVMLILKYTIGVRVDEKVELEGLDLEEHGYEAYPKAS